MKMMGDCRDMGNRLVHVKDKCLSSHNGIGWMLLTRMEYRCRLGIYMDMEIAGTRGINLKVLNRDAIKYIAMFTMLLNHIANMFMTSGTVLYEVLEDIGYFTAPVMCFFLVEGFDYTSSRTKYGQRLIVFAVISQIPYRLAFQSDMLNMFYTLLCCFLILVSLELVVTPVYKAFVCVLLIIATAAGTWSFAAPICTMLLYYSKNSRVKTALSFGATYAVFVPFNIHKYMYDVPGNWTLYAVKHGLLSGVGILAAALVILVFYNGQRAKHAQNFSKWFFYIFYPAHLLVLYFAKVYITHL